MSSSPEELDRIAQRLGELAAELDRVGEDDEKAADLAREAAELSTTAAGNIAEAVRAATGSGSRRLD